METLKNKWNHLSLRQFLIWTVLLAAGIVVLLSAMIIGACASFRHWLLPDPNAVYLTVEETRADGAVIKGTYLLNLGDDLSELPFLREENDGVPGSERVKQTRYAIQKLENSVETLSPKRKLAYQVCGITMFVAPTLLAFTAIFLCSMIFYRYKLKKPLGLLADATKQIADQNLDFEITYDRGDEMGELCRSFEAMRTSLYENKKAMWSMLEERRLLQASVAHDLRNPIAIIEGYTEYLQGHLEQGELSREKLTRMVQKIDVAAKRMEQYTDSVRLLNQSEEMQADRRRLSVIELAEGIQADLSLLAEKNQMALRTTKNLPEQEILVDDALLYRILENIMNNALRYAREEILLDFVLTGGQLTVALTDDGEGFPPEILSRKENTLLTAGKDGHMGIGLSISRLLCKKHGGYLELSNTSRGACVKIVLLV